jgi:carbonic anhydrase
MKLQSPIAITSADAAPVEGAALIFDKLLLEPTDFVGLPEHLYLDTPNLVQQLHAPVVGSARTEQGEQFVADQLHFHVPAEHVIDGVVEPAEIHLRLEDPAGSGKLAVLAVLVESGKRNDAFDELLRAREAPVSAEISVQSLLPKSLGFYSYIGSTTTPPFEQDVRWYVLREPVEFSDEQLATLAELHRVPNRPLQPLAGRSVYRTP